MNKLVWASAGQRCGHSAHATQTVCSVHYTGNLNGGPFVVSDKSWRPLINYPQAQCIILSAAFGPNTHKGHITLMSCNCPPNFLFTLTQHPNTAQLGAFEVFINCYLHLSAEDSFLFPLPDDIISSTLSFKWQRHVSQMWKFLPYCKL